MVSFYNVSWGCGSNTATTTGSYTYETAPWQWITTGTTCSSNTCTVTTSPWDWGGRQQVKYTWRANDWDAQGYVNAKIVWHGIEETKEQLEARRERERIAAEERAIENARLRAELAAAEARAEEILVRQLDAEQKAQWLAEKLIHIRSQRGRRYCISGKQKSHNIHELDEEGNRVKELCVYPSGNLPTGDTVLGQMLALMYAEDEILSKANTWDLLNGRQLMQRALVHDPAAPLPEAVLAPI